MNDFPTVPSGAHPVIGVKQLHAIVTGVEPARPDRLRIGVDASIMAGPVPTLLRQLHSDYPTLRWSLHESSPAKQYDALCRGQIDVGIWRENPIDSAQLLQHRLCQQWYGREDIAIALPKGHRLARRNSIALTDLAGELLLALPAPSAAFQEQLLRCLRGAGAGLQIAHEANSLPTLMAMVGGGIGLALVPSSTGSIVFPNITVRRLRGAPSTNLYLAHSIDSQSSGIQPFLEVLNKERGVSPFCAPVPHPIRPA
ncbi:MAG TPA: LysR family substrate-binding domain-containing protein [Telluria sp.]|nr:LysR family substrate-binding domain-containing protein [Telluria sp.]